MSLSSKTTNPFSQPYCPPKHTRVVPLRDVFAGDFNPLNDGGNTASGISSTGSGKLAACTTAVEAGMRWSSGRLGPTTALGKSTNEHEMRR